jgi:hypothetical protein
MPVTESPRGPRRGREWVQLSIAMRARPCACVVAMRESAGARARRRVWWLVRAPAGERNAANHSNTSSSAAACGTYIVATRRGATRRGATEGDATQGFATNRVATRRVLPRRGATEGVGTHRVATHRVATHHVATAGEQYSAAVRAKTACAYAAARPITSLRRGASVCLFSALSSVPSRACACACACLPDCVGMCACACPCVCVCMRACAAERHQRAHNTWHGERRAAADALAERQRIITCDVRMQRATSGATLDCNIRCNVGAARDCEGVSAFVNVCVRSRRQAIRRAFSAVSTEITGERPRAAANKQTNTAISSGSSRQNNKHVTASLELASHV